MFFVLIFQSIHLPYLNVYFAIDFCMPLDVLYVYSKYGFTFIVTTLEIITTKDVFIKKCQNCGKYFIPVNRNDEIYCNNIFKNDRACKEIGSMNVWRKKLETDDITRLYRTIYHMKFNRVKRNPTNEGYSSDFEWWKNNVKEWKDNIKKGKKTEDEFKTWLLKTRDKR